MSTSRKVPLKIACTKYLRLIQSQSRLGCRILERWASGASLHMQHLLWPGQLLPWQGFEAWRRRQVASYQLELEYWPSVAVQILQRKREMVKGGEGRGGKGGRGEGDGKGRGERGGREREMVKGEGDEGEGDGKGRGRGGKEGKGVREIEDEVNSLFLMRALPGKCGDLNFAISLSGKVGTLNSAISSEPLSLFSVLSSLRILLTVGVFHLAESVLSVFTTFPLTTGTSSSCVELWGLLEDPSWKDLAAGSFSGWSLGAGSPLSLRLPAELLPSPLCGTLSSFPVFFKLKC